MKNTQFLTNYTKLQPLIITFLQSEFLILLYFKNKNKHILIRGLKLLLIFLLTLLWIIYCGLKFAAQQKSIIQLFFCRFKWSYKTTRQLHNS
jgi:hypothetical protein